jgi:hypothetical protein
MSFKKTRLFLLLLVFVLGSPALVWAQKVVNLSKNDGSSSSAKIASQGSNIYVVWEDNELGNLNLDIFMARSTNGGKTFSPRVNLSNNSGDSVNVQIAVSGNNVYLVWGDNAVTNGDIFFIRSTDGGATFETAQNLVNNSTPSLFPQIAVDGDNVYVVWHEASGANADIFFRRSTDGGATFAAAQNLSNNAGLSMFPQIVVSDGNIYVAWEDDIPGNVDIFFTRSTDGGVSFEAVQNLSDNSGLSEKFQLGAASGNVYVVWHDFTDFANTFGDIFLRRSTDSGESFEAAVNLSSTPDGFSQAPSLAVDEINVYVAWEDDSPGNIDILLRRSKDGGANFEAAKNLSVKQTGNSLNAKIAALGKKVAVAWMDDTSGTFDIMLSNSTNGGQTFPKTPFNFTKTKKSAGTAEKPAIAIQAGKKATAVGKTLIAWEQDIPDTENRDIFFSTK